MAAPMFVARSYAGGAPVAYITAPMGASDTSFTITPTTGWTTPDSNPLGVDGPFVVAVDLGLATEEKILCTSLNLSTGLVEVYNTGGFFGRGYDQTNATSHTPSGGSPLNGAVQVVWTAVEASEANTTVTYVLGSAGGTPTNGEVFTWSDGHPMWGAPGSLVANPSGRMHQSVLQAIGPSSNVKLVNMAEDFVNGGVTFNNNSLVVPVAGTYSVAGGVPWANNSNAGLYAAQLFRNGSVVIAYGSGITCTPTDGVTPTFSDQIVCALNDELALGAYQNLGGAADTQTGGWLAIALVTQAS